MFAIIMIMTMFVGCARNQPAHNPIPEQEHIAIEENVQNEIVEDDVNSEDVETVANVSGPANNSVNEGWKELANSFQN